MNVDLEKDELILIIAVLISVKKVLDEETFKVQAGLDIGIIADKLGVDSIQKEIAQLKEMLANLEKKKDTYKRLATKLEPVIEALGVKFQDVVIG